MTIRHQKETRGTKMISFEEKIKPEVNIGISLGNREAIAAELSKVLADSYALYLKTQKYHWNVTGEHFMTLHDQFEEMYTELATAIDEIAERIRILGFKSPGSFAEYLKLISIEEDTDFPDAMEMINRLVKDNEQLIRTTRNALKHAQLGEDESTIDLLTQRLQTHSKTAWILRSQLE